MAMLNEWLSLADGMIQRADTYRTSVQNPPGGRTWSGDTAGAIKAMADNDHTAIENMSTAIKTMAQTALDSIYEPVILNLITAIAMYNDLIAKHYLVDENLHVTPDFGTLDMSLAALSALAGDCEAKSNALRAAAQTWWDSDQVVADQITADQGKLAANFDVTGGLTAADGAADGSDLANGNLSDEEKARLIAAASLPPDMAAALANWQPGQPPVVIGAERMAYLYQISQALNGLPPDKIREIMNNLPPDARAALSRGLALVSNTNVRSGISNAEGATDATSGTFIPAAGSVNNLPSGIREALTRPASERVSVTDPTVAYGSDGSGFPVAGLLQLSHVGELQDVAEIFRGAAETGIPGGPGPTTDGSLPQSYAGYAMNGSEASRLMLEATSQYANADIDHPASPWMDRVSDQLAGTPGDLRGALADVVSVAGHDHVGVHDLVTGPGGDDFLRSFLQENWGDQSGKVGTAFDWMDNNPLNRLNAETANGVAHYLGDHLSEFQSMPGGGTFGADNPLLDQAVAQGLSPYLTALAGADPGLTHITGIEHFQDQEHMANMFSVLDQDHDAGAIINNAALIQREALELAAAEYGVHGDEIRVATRLGLAMGEGAQDFEHFSDAAATSAAAQARDSQGVAFDTAAAAVSGLTGLVPGGQIPALLERVLTPELKSELLDPANPAARGDHYLDNWLSSQGINMTVHENATIVQGILNAHPELAGDPTLQQYLSNGRIDYSTLRRGGADDVLEAWLTAHKDLYDPVTFGKQQEDARMEQDLHRPW